MLKRLPWLGLIAALGAVPTRDANACGGGVGEETNTSVAVDAQRAFISLRSDGSTDVVVELAVNASENFGVILPVPYEPTIDPNPIDAGELDTLDATTQVEVLSVDYSSGSSGGGCFCGGAGDAAGDGGNEFGERVVVGSFVDVGGVTAAAVSATDSTALQTWLDENGFTLSAEAQPTIDSYIGEGKWFLVFKKNGEVVDGANGLGVHFTLPGDARGYPLKMARLGAASEVAITVFVVAPEGVAPTAPFETLTVDELMIYDSEDMSASYRAAVGRAVEDNDGHAFVIEGVHEIDSGEVITTPGLSALVDPGQKLTRITTVLKKENLDTDVAFTEKAPDDVTDSTETVSLKHQPKVEKFERRASSNRIRYGALFAIPALAFLGRRRRRS